MSPTSHMWSSSEQFLLTVNHFIDVTDRAVSPQITSSVDKEAVTFKKLVKGHAYSVTGVDEVSGSQSNPIPQPKWQHGDFCNGQDPKCQNCKE